MNQNRDHLIPTAVTDKNGKQTTVHKKAVTETTNPTWLPKVSFPTVNRIQKRTALENETTALLVNLNYNDPSRSNGKLMQIIADEKLRDLLTTHDDPEAVAAIIITRDMTDTEQITGLYEAMRSAPSALNDGSL